MFDPKNKVVQLCVEGMKQEGEGKIADAQQFFKQAWDAATNDLEAFTAAHYLARNQEDPEQSLKWNLEALNKANLIKDDRMKGHYPSLFLSVGKSYENLNNIPEASVFYKLAAESSNQIPAGPYSDMIRSGIREGLKRTNTECFSNEVIDELINTWCNAKDLKPLSLILPAYIGNLGSETEINKLVSALSYLCATRCLNKTEQERVEKLIVDFAATLK